MVKKARDRKPAKKAKTRRPAPSGKEVARRALAMAGYAVHRPKIRKAREQPVDTPAAALQAVASSQDAVTKQAVRAYLDCSAVVEESLLSADLPSAPIGDNQASFRWSTQTYAQLSINGDASDGNVYYGLIVNPVAVNHLRVTKTYTNGVPAAADNYNCEGYSLWAAGFQKVRCAYMSLRVLNNSSEMYSAGCATVGCLDAGATVLSRVSLEGEHASTTYSTRPGVVMNYPWLGREPNVDYQWNDPSAGAVTTMTGIAFQGVTAATTYTQVRVCVYAIWEGIPLFDTDTLYNATLRPVDRGAFTRYLMAEIALRPVDERRCLKNVTNAQADGVRTGRELATMGSTIVAAGRRFLGAVRGSQGATLGQRVMSTLYNLWNEAVPITARDWTRRVLHMLRPEEFAAVRDWLVAHPTATPEDFSAAHNVPVDQDHPRRVSDRALNLRRSLASASGAQAAALALMQRGLMPLRRFDGDDEEAKTPHPSVDLRIDRDYVLANEPRRGTAQTSPASASRRASSARR